MRKAIVSMFALFFWFAFVSSFFAGGPVLAQSSSVTVSLTAVDAKNPTITVTYDGKSKQLELAKDVFVEIDGKKAEYRSLIPGDEAEIIYDKARAVDSTPFAFTKWGPGKPNNKQDSEHYLLLYIADDNWSDQPDRSHQHTTFFVCEWEAK